MLNRTSTKTLQVSAIISYSFSKILRVIDFAAYNQTAKMKNRWLSKDFFKLYWNMHEVASLYILKVAASALGLARFHFTYWRENLGTRVDLADKLKDLIYGNATGAAWEAIPLTPSAHAVHGKFKI